MIKYEFSSTKRRGRLLGKTSSRSSVGVLGRGTDPPSLAKPTLTQYPAQGDFGGRGVRWTFCVEKRRTSLLWTVRFDRNLEVTVGPDPLLWGGGWNYVKICWVLMQNIWEGTQKTPSHLINNPNRTLEGFDEAEKPPPVCATLLLEAPLWESVCRESAHRKHPNSNIQTSWPLAAKGCRKRKARWFPWSELPTAW